MLAASGDAVAGNKFAVAARVGLTLRRTDVFEQVGLPLSASELASSRLARVCESASSGHGPQSFKVSVHRSAARGFVGLISSSSN